MIPNAIRKYATQKLNREIAIIRNSTRSIELQKLNIYEKAIVFKYSEDGYETLNETLRDSRGKTNTEFGKLLIKVLDKLSDFEELVYRSANLTTKEFQRYSRALITKNNIREYSVYIYKQIKVDSYGF